MTGRRLPAVLSGAAMLLGWAQGAHAQTRADLIPLGRSAASGAVCEAVRDYDDPRLQLSGWFCQGGATSIERL